MTATVVVLLMLAVVLQAAARRNAGGRPPEVTRRYRLASVGAAVLAMIVAVIDAIAN